MEPVPNREVEVSMMDGKMSEQLKKARDYEKEQGVKILPDERPAFHVTPTVGWINDPNGFSLYKGEYHLFYQYHPYDIHWGPMHWGHLKTKDFIKWERLPVVMAPDHPYDEFGCFSGSAVELADGRHLLMYTGVLGGPDESPLRRQVQCLAVGDGVDYEKYEGNPVIGPELLPEGNSPIDFRDPKIWWDEEDGCYYAVVGDRTADDSGAILLYTSPDGFSWSYVTTLDRCENRYGKMWECPDFFQVNGKWILITSPQEMEAQGLEFHKGNDVICISGTYDKKNHQFTREAVTAVDYGLDFYAPQTVLTSDGRRVMIAWMQAWANSRFHHGIANWMGMFTLPRELSFANGRLVQNPVRELLQYRREPVFCRDVEVEGISRLGEIGGVRLDDVSGRMLDMTVDVRPAEGQDIYDAFVIRFARDDEYGTSLTYRPKKGTVLLDRGDSGFRFDVVTRREAPVRDRGGVIRLRLILDRFSAEIFINDGEQVMSACIYTPQEADGIYFEAKGKAVIDVEKYDIVVE